jgi:sugar lactone lactonase YvrE
LKRLHAKLDAANAERVSRSGLFFSACPSAQVDNTSDWTLINYDGATRNPRSFASVQEPDGICVAPLGRLYVAAKNNCAGALVVLDSTGASVAVVPITDGPTNCEFGGVAAKTLFITARVPKTRN